MAENGYALRAEGIGKSYGRTVVLKSASLWAERGKITTLLGRNGSGKTTLLRIASGWLRPDHGVVTLNGRARERCSLADMAREGLMFIPQEQLLSSAYRVRDHVDALVSTFGAAHVEWALDEMRASDLLDRRVPSLSGGERMRVSLALAMLRRPDVLLVDEPLAGVAPKDQESLGVALGTLAGEGTAVVTSGHDARILLSISDVILWSVAGTTHHIGSSAEAVRHEQFRREYLGPGFEPEDEGPAG